MKSLIFSDLHANLFGLEKVLEYASSHNIDNICSLGDIIGYNSFANECTELIKRNEISSIKGNHECLLLDEISMDTCRTERSRNAINITKQFITKENMAFLQNLPEELSINKASIFIHGGFHSVYETINTDEKAEKNFKALEGCGKKIAFFGHTHRPGVYIKKKDTGNIKQAAIEEKLFINEEDLYLVNPGSCGEPRHGLPFSFIIYDDEENTVDFEIFELTPQQIDSVKRMNKQVFGSTSFKRFPGQVKEKTRKLYYKIGKLKDNLSRS